ncbi:protein of unknown function [Pseudomonas inefficax]|uniref:Uncharacterized protein n=1 Tax=Pseudomonas inefficax TaxID=2078786 RepID=A0AAQ1PE41_9PSED|nr:protein of unknown function [Pseudomonas inefficax]
MSCSQGRSGKTACHCRHCAPGTGRRLWSFVQSIYKVRLPTNVSPVPASSRARPLPQILHSPQILWGLCGSGFTREEASTGKNQSPDNRPQPCPPS